MGYEFIVRVFKVSLSFFVKSWVLFNIASLAIADGLTLNWQAPTQFINGSPLNAIKDLKEYRLYYGASEQSIKENVVFLKPSERSVALSLLELSQLNSSIVYFAMTSVLNDGSESDPSPSIFYLP